MKPKKQNKITFINDWSTVKARVDEIYENPEQLEQVQ